MNGLRVVLAGLLTMLIAAAPAQARDATVTSADGTPIAATLLTAEGLKAGQKAPTVLMTHGWGGNRETDGNAAGSDALGTAGVGALRRAGFNVLTWDSRGFGQSGGTVTVDYRGNEGRDVQALITWLAKQPEAQLDKPGDPRVGMHGASYAGGIELVSAAIDKRIDAIAPDIAWHSLITSLYKESTVKGGWSLALYGAGVPTAGLEGIVAPGGVQTGNLDPHITSAFVSGAATGTLSAADRAWFASRGPGALVDRIRVPTLLIQGTADTLFTLDEAVTNYRILRGNGVPAKMMWFCGGHGACLTGSGEAGHVERAVVAWMRRHLAKDAKVDTGPRFEWLADDAQWRSGPGYPLPAGKPIVAEGAGTLAINPGDAASGTPISAGPAVNAINVAVPAPNAATQVAGAPRLRLAYSGTGTATHAFAQLVDTTRGVAVGNQVTPIPVKLDGKPHTVTRPLERVAASLTPQSRLELQIIGGSQVYGPVRSIAALQVSKAHLELPTVGAIPARQGGSAPVLPNARTCTSRRRFVIHLRGRLKKKGTRVYVGGRRVKVRGRHGKLRAIVDLRGRTKQRVKVRIVAKRRSGKVVRETRRYRTCATRRR